LGIGRFYPEERKGIRIVHRKAGWAKGREVLEIRVKGGRRKGGTVGPPSSGKQKRGGGGD